MLRNPASRSLCAALIALAFYGAYLWVYARNNFGGNASGLLHFSWNIYRLEPNPDLIISDDNGYDGQFYYYVALDPAFSNRPLMEEMKVTGYRYQRILYPLLSRALSLGRREALPITMVLLNLAALCAGTFLLAEIFRGRGNSPFWALLFAFSVGPLIGLVRCTAEPLSLLALLAAVYFFMERKNVAASVLCFCAGLFAREIILGAAAIFALHLALRREKISRVAAYAIPFAVFFLWQIVVWQRTGEWLPTFHTPMAAQSFSFIPFSGLYFKWMDLARSLRPDAFGFSFVEMMVALNILFAGGVILYWGIKNRKDFQAEEFLFAGLGLVYFANMHPATIAPAAMLDLWGFGRHSVEIFLSLMLLYAFRREKILIIPVVIHTCLWAALAVILL